MAEKTCAVCNLAIEEPGYVWWHEKYYHIICFLHVIYFEYAEKEEIK